MEVLMKRDRIWLLVAGTGIGAAAMALLDPSRGARRRSWLRDKMANGAHLSNRIINKKSKHLQNEAFGAVAERKARMFDRDVPDDVLEERVKAQIGHVLNNNSKVNVKARDGHVVVEGPVCRGERDKLADRLDVTRGVRSYELLVIEYEPDDLPGAEGVSWPQIRSA
jgi:hypothetical protein